jgi:hypothetical protein
MMCDAIAYHVTIYVCWSQEVGVVLPYFKVVESIANQLLVPDTEQQKAKIT